MRRLTNPLVVLLVLAVVLVGCKPGNMSETVYGIGQDSLVVIDQYIDGELGYDVLIPSLEDAQINLENLYEGEEEIEYSISALLLRDDLADAALNIMLNTLGGAEMEEVLKYRNAIADSLNKNSRDLDGEKD